METKPTEVKGAPDQAVLMEGLGLGSGLPVPESVLGPCLKSEEPEAPDSRRATAVRSGNVSCTPRCGQPHQGAREAEKDTPRPVRAHLLGQWRGQPEKGEASTEMRRSGRVFPVALHSLIYSFIHWSIYRCLTIGFVDPSVGPPLLWTELYTPNPQFVFRSSNP